MIALLIAARDILITVLMSWMGFAPEATELQDNTAPTDNTIVVSVNR